MSQKGGRANVHVSADLDILFFFFFFNLHNWTASWQQLEDESSLCIQANS